MGKIAQIAGLLVRNVTIIQRVWIEPFAHNWWRRRIGAKVPFCP